MTAMRSTACYLAILFVPCLCFPVKFSAKDCGASAGHYQSFDVVPSTPKTGEVFKVTNHFTFDGDVSGGQFAVKVTALGGIPLKHQTGPLCGIDTSYDVYLAVVKVATVTIYGSTCPIARGPADIKYDIKLLSILPPVLGDASFHLTAKDQKGTDIFCVQAKLGIQLEDAAPKKAEVDESNACLDGGAACGSGPCCFSPDSSHDCCCLAGQRCMSFSGTSCGMICAPDTATGAFETMMKDMGISKKIEGNVDAETADTYMKAVEMLANSNDAQAGECLEGYYGRCHPEALSSQPLLAPRYPSCSRCCHGFSTHCSQGGCHGYCKSKAVEMLSAPVLAAPAGISLKHSDCGGKGSHAPIVDFGPSAVALGKKTTMVGHGKLDETVKSANFDLTMTGKLGTMLHCSGDASITKSCPLPMGFGSLTMQGMSFPLQPGNVPVNVDMYLKETTPKDLLTTTTVAKATDENGDEIFCIKIESTPTASGNADMVV